MRVRFSATVSHGPSARPGRALRACLAAVALCAAGHAMAQPVVPEYAEITRLIGAGQHEQALQLADSYLASRPRDPQVRFLRTLALSDGGRKSDALSELAQLTRDHPELPEPHNNLAVLWAERGDFDNARAALESAIRANPAYAVAHENLGDVHARMAAQSWQRAGQLGAASATPKLTQIRQMLQQMAAPSR
jgi:Flp pilus assembly protein TadD